MAFQVCKMKFLHNLYKPCPKTFWILPEFGKYKRILLLSFPPYTASKSIFNILRFYGGTTRKVFCIPNERLCLFSYHVLCKEQRKQ